MGQVRSKFEILTRDFPEVPGLKFHPTDEQFINPYLQNKNEGNLAVIDPIRTEQDVFSRHPGTLQAHYPLLALENDLFLYTSRVAKYPNIGKLEIERAGGFWMVSKRSVPIGAGIGHKRVLNFMEGSVKSYTPTNWYMEEYSIKKYNPNQEDEDWIIVRIYQQLTMPMLLHNIVPMTMPLSTMPIPTTFPLTPSMPNPQEMLQPTYVFPSQSPRSQLIFAGSLSPDPEIQTWADAHANSGGWSGSAYYLPLDSDEGDISGSAYHFQPPGSGGTGMDGGRSRFEILTRDFPEVPGLKFHPTDEQFINPYLQNKNEGNLAVIDPIRTEQDVFSRHPGTLQAHYPLLALKNDLFLYTSRVAKYPNIGKLEIERAGGFWMVSKRSVPIGAGIGHKRVLNFMEGSIKSYTPTNWYMVEYSIKKYNPNQEDKDWIIVRIYQQLTMPMPLTNIVPMTMPLSAMPIPTTFPLTMSMPTPQGMLQPTYVFPSQSPRSQLISAGSLSPDPEIQTWADSHADSGGWSGSAYFLPLDSFEGDISGSAYPFQPPGSG